MRINQRLYEAFVVDHVDSLATDTEYVRGRLGKYANDLLSLGVDGLRIDAAKREFHFNYPYCSVLIIATN